MEYFRAYMTAGFDNDESALVVHLAKEGAEKTACRAYPVLAIALTSRTLPDQPWRVCPACLDVLRVDWLLEDATTRK